MTSYLESLHKEGKEMKKYLAEIELKRVLDTIKTYIVFTSEKTSRQEISNSSLVTVLNGLDEREIRYKVIGPHYETDTILEIYLT